ncbi:putative endonuclease [Salinibacillus kushneri]|uniref:Putative endonuclease n=1 Tax=Salinibacillus kushneri TaxID=237682 RepID=A0A1I0AS88_9BACI|nr:GIY-YIG nuclease family protein [Salinibacillus kushneri]SES97041.1 putative endonuclease [Salinibacillus kushneri]
MHYTYILRCGDNSLYTGYTNRLNYRMKMHNEGKGAKYTKGRGPFQLVYVETHHQKSVAMKREYQIKQMRKEEKEELIKTQCVLDTFIKV